MSVTKQKINDDIKTAMKNKDVFKRDILRMIKNEIEVAEKTALRELSEEEVVTAVNRYKKTVQDQIDEAVKNQRTENLENFNKELEVVLYYLPKQLSEQEIRKIVQDVINENGFNGKKDIGKVMKIISPKTKGAADGKLVNKIVVELLG